MVIKRERVVFIVAQFLPTTGCCITPIKKEAVMTDTHCPGFESNKSLSEVKVTCTVCDKEWEVFSDEVDKTIKCPACGNVVDPKDVAS